MAADLRPALLAAAMLLSACATSSQPIGPQDRFIANLMSLCGQRLEGRIVSPPVAADADFAGKPLVAHVRDCSPDVIRIPFAVGNDSSRTWVISRTGPGLRLKHDHRHEDGTEDKISQYGGDSMSPGTERRQEFPADPFTKGLLLANGNRAGVDNVWALEASPNFLAYELRRPGRFFRVEFTRPASR